MTPKEWHEIAREVEALWGRSQKWSKADEVYSYAVTVPASAARQAVQDIYLEGRATVPPPAEVLGKARAKITDSTTLEEIERYCANNRHSLGIIEEAAGVRTAICGRCRHEETRPAHLFPTIGEIEDGIFTGRPDQREDLTDRIAP